MEVSMVDLVKMANEAGWDKFVAGLTDVHGRLAADILMLENTGDLDRAQQLTEIYKLQAQTLSELEKYRREHDL